MATAMGGNLSKYTPIFLVLALSGILFLLRNIHTLEVSRSLVFYVVRQTERDRAKS